jgi:ribonuclease BN (tRNA processing enzyme)
MGLTVTVLGCSGTYAAPGNACTGYLVGDGETSVWLDCGPGTLANLQSHVALSDLDALVISHVHPDHWTELPVLRNALKYGVHREGFPVYGTAEVKLRAEAALGESITPTIDWTTIDSSMRVEVGGLRFSFSQTDHPVETLAMRVAADDVALAYSADTGPGWSFTAFTDRGEAIDLALCEATLTPEFEGQAPHLSAREAGERARAAGARRLVITHHWPGVDLGAAGDQAATAFGGPVEIAAVHERYHL